MNIKSPADKRGGVILAVVIFAVIVLILLGTALSYAASERRMNVRTDQYNESKYAAEALAEYGVAQIREKFSKRSNVTLGSSSAADKLQLPPSAFWAGSNVETSSLELKAGTVQNVLSGGSGTMYKIDPADKANDGDPNRGQWVVRKDVPILAKATVYPDSSHAGQRVGQPLTIYALYRLSVRAVPLFAHAVFYNMDFEIFPGPAMKIWGPTHVNGSAFVSSKGGLDFKDTVTMTGNIYHSWKSSIASTHGTGSEELGTSSVNFKGPSGAMLDMYTGGKWMDSLMGTVPFATNLAITDKTRKDPGFDAFANARWGSNLQTGVAEYKPVALGSYSEDTDSDTSAAHDNSNNSGRQIIEPANWPTDTAAADYKDRLEVENNKFSTKAGVYITVTPPATSSGSATITAVSRKKGTAAPVATLTLPSGLVTWNGFKYNSSTQEVEGGLYDARRGDVQISGSKLGTLEKDAARGINVVEVDVAKLKTAVDAMAANKTTGAITGLTTDNWSGIVYVEVTGGPTTNTDGSTNAGTNAKTYLTGVRLKNGADIPSYGTANPGLTVATNVPLYVQGNYNADGTVNSDSSEALNSACAPETGEQPAALVADAITLLSSNWSDKNSYKTISPTSADKIEVSAAMLMGLTPTNKNGSLNSSGGLHNFPRFLEDWGSGARKSYIRGSMVALFETRIANENFTTRVYAPPSRDWGFNRLFRDGSFPPGTPMVMTFRRAEYRELTKTQYDALKTSYGW